MINIEMFKRIENIIIANPEMHSQLEYEYEDSCGTTRCIAGWAIHLWGQDNGRTGSLWQIRHAWSGGRLSSSHEAGQRILGLTPQEADELFYCMDNERALEMVQQYARGLRNLRAVV